MKGYPTFFLAKSPINEPQRVKRHANPIKPLIKKRLYIYKIYNIKILLNNNIIFIIIKL